MGTKAVGDVGALIWVAEQLKLVEQINRACRNTGANNGPSVGEMVLTVAIQRACAAGPKCKIEEFLTGCVLPVSCLPPSKFTGQAFHSLAKRVSMEELEQAQLAIARQAVSRFKLSTDVLAFDTTNCDTPIATTTDGELARRGNAKSKRRDLRVVGLGLLVSETGHVPLLHRTYPGNQADQKVLESPNLLEGQKRGIEQALQREIGILHDGQPGIHSSNVGPYNHGWQKTAPYIPLSPRIDHGATQGGQNLQTRQMAPCNFFIEESGPSEAG
ncbi:MAG: hypothetical protein MJE77_38495 [Proteobacteria bacterium]|nr:hypothetical protein [Pseudomonadota bacterium]